MSYHIRVGARGIVIHDEKVLLNEFGNGEYYNIPGGGVEPGETVRDAVIREIMEESGLRVTVGDLIYVLEYEPNKCNFIYGQKPTISLVFRCYLEGSDIIEQPSIPDIDPEDSSLISTAKWVEISKLKDIHYVPYIQDELMEYIQTGKFTPVFLEELLIRR